MEDENSARSQSISRLGSSPSDEETHLIPQDNIATVTTDTDASKALEKANAYFPCESNEVLEEAAAPCAEPPTGTPATLYAEKNPQFDIIHLPIEAQFDRIEKEFSKVEACTMSPRQYNFTSSYAFPTKNRYINVMANEETLFPPLRSPRAMRSSMQKDRSTGQRILDSLRRSSTSAIDMAAGDDGASSLKANSMTASAGNVPLYFNANILDMGLEPIFVASQAPVLDCMEDFLNAVYNYEMPIILMLTELEEGGFAKADRYWPADNSSGLAVEAFGNMAVYKDPNEPYTFDAKHELVWRPFFIRPCDAARQKEHKVTMVQYIGWPDRDVPNSTESFEELLNIIATKTATKGKTTPTASASASASNANSRSKKCNPKDRKPLVLVHCSAGIGRTGTLIGAYTAIKLMEAGKLTQDSIRKILVAMRKARFGMVQRIEQYMFLYFIVLQHFGADTTQFAARMQQRANSYNLRWMEARQAK
ncbi:protein-tyrosine phosphatase 1-like protein [Leptomonas seymouri]|uniref:Protein-tyrosine phosphatase 1-like protein n=1 Tax=Leptomonas seymouri TaxID=5684 RepID=A0A0N1ILN6_LEPSE|nr:protein-tyrosine phosphatase 1-like protein [Leptomonas seymouri]|eukprot:KPI88582.1 protein-tyrosine phosphatase 1-like protein [Leptomonas seymouri]